MLTATINKLEALLGSADNCALVILALTAFILLGAVKFDIFFGFDPCSLCMTQRLFFLLAGIFSGLSIVHNPHLIVYPVLSGLSSLGGTAITVQHNWLLWGPVDSSSCGPDVLYLIDFDYPVIDILKALTVGSASCSDDLHKPFAVVALVAFLSLLYVAIKHIRICVRRKAAARII